MSIAYEEKANTALQQLGLKTALGHLDQASQQAAAQGWSYIISWAICSTGSSASATGVL